MLPTCYISCAYPRKIDTSILPLSELLSDNEGTAIEKGRETILIGKKFLTSIQ